ncbi:MAG: alpha/beta hydrolase [Candidatus Saccharimonadales bacterium]
MSKLQLVSIRSKDKLILPGLLYSPPAPTKTVAVWLHGMGDNGMFYNPPRINALGKSLNEKNIAFFSFNNRGAHHNKVLRIDDSALPEKSQHYQAGTYFEKIADCVQDIDGALDFLYELGFSTFYLLGHSTGANKICTYHASSSNNPFSKYVLAAPSDDIGGYYDELGKDKFWRTLDRAKDLVNKGKSYKAMALSSGMHPFSAQAAVDIMDPDGAYNTFPYYEEKTKRIGTKPLFQEYSTFDKPTLVVFGEQDEYQGTAGNAEGACNILEKYLPETIQADSAFKLIKNTDHGFHGAEQEFAETIARWLTK